MVGLFVVAAAVTLVAIPPAWPSAVGAGAGRVCWTTHRPRATRPRRPLPEDPTPMASTRPNPASPSDDPTGDPARRSSRATGVRSRPPAAGHDPGRRPCDGDGVVELEGTAAMAGLAELLGEPEARVWVDLDRPDAGARRSRSARRSALHPLIVEDVLEGNQRAKIETTDGLVHIVLFHLTTATQVVASELDIVLGEGFLLTVHDVDWDPRDRPPPARRRRARSWRTARTTCCGRSPTTSSTATSRSRTGSATRSTRSRTRSSARRPRTRSSGCSSSSASSSQVRRAISPVREVFNQLDQPRRAAHRRRRDRLLPRHLRPRHPADRRARQLPRARLGDARRLPDPGQQQPVGDHEAADRGDGHPGRDRRGGRDLRDERGRRSASTAAKATGSGWSPLSWSAVAVVAAVVLRRIDWI